MALAPSYIRKAAAAGLPCPYTAGRHACRSGIIGHAGPHDFDRAGDPCDYFLHSSGIPPMRCKAGLYGHPGRHEYERTGN